jgi:hypothetical protein
VEATFFTAASVLMVIAVALLRPRTVSKGSPADETGGFLAAHPWSVAAVIAAALVIVRFLWPRLKPRLLDEWRQAKQGAQIFRDRRRYARDVALPSAGSYACRIGVNVVFMADTLSQLFAITPGGVGQTQALDVATLRRYASSHDVAAFSITQDSIITLWNVVLGIAVMLWAFGWQQMKTLLPRHAAKATMRATEP